MHESIILSLPLPPASPTRLQYYCDTVTQYSAPFRPPGFTPYTIQYCALQYRVKAKCCRSALQLLSERYRSRVTLLFHSLSARHRRLRRRRLFAARSAARCAALVYIQRCPAATMSASKRYRSSIRAPRRHRLRRRLFAPRSTARCAALFYIQRCPAATK